MNYQKKMGKVLLNIKKERLFLILSILPLSFQKSKNISDTYIKTCEELKGSKGKFEAKENLVELFHKKIERFEKFHKGIRVRRKLLILSLLIIILAFYSTITSQIKGSHYENFFSNNKMFFVFSYTCYALLIAFILSSLLYSHRLLVIAKGKYTKLLVNYRNLEAIGSSGTTSKDSKIEEQEAQIEPSNGLKALLVDFGSLMFILNSDKIIEIKNNRGLARIGQKYIPFDFGRRKKNNNQDTQRLEKIIGGEETKESIIREKISQYEYGSSNTISNFCSSDYNGICMVRINPDIFLTLFSKWNEEFLFMDSETLEKFEKEAFRFSTTPNKSISKIDDFIKYIKRK